MALREPKPGLAIRYDYLWTRGAAAGKQQSKDRPTCLVAASDSTVAPRFVVILPITHSAPTDDTVGMEIPAKVAQALGLGRGAQLDRPLNSAEQGQTAGLRR